MTTQGYKKIDKKQADINKINSKKVKIYEDYIRKDNLLNTRLKKDEENLHIYKIQIYSDNELRKDIISEAIENNYPVESVAALELYFEEKKWDINVPDEIVDKFVTLELYNEQSKKNKGFLRRVSERIYAIFFQGGDHQ